MIPKCFQNGLNKASGLNTQGVCILILFGYKFFKLFGEVTFSELKHIRFSQFFRGPEGVAQLLRHTRVDPLKDTDKAGRSALHNAAYIGHPALESERERERERERACSPCVDPHGYAFIDYLLGILGPIPTLG